MMAYCYVSWTWQLTSAPGRHKFRLTATARAAGSPVMCLQAHKVSAELADYKAESKGIKNQELTLRWAGSRHLHAANIALMMAYNRGS